MAANIEVIEERVAEHRKSIDHLRKHSHELTNSYVSMSETLKQATKDVATLFTTVKDLSKEIDEFRLSLKEKEIKHSMIKYIIMTWPKYIIRSVFFLVVIALAFEHDNYEHLHKILGL